jgi:hypothetical protein
MEQVLAAHGLSKEQIASEVSRVRKINKAFGKKRGWSKERTQRYIDHVESNYEWIEIDF